MCRGLKAATGLKKANKERFYYLTPPHMHMEVLLRRNKDITPFKINKKNLHEQSVALAFTFLQAFPIAVNRLRSVKYEYILSPDTVKI